MSGKFIALLLVTAALLGVLPCKIVWALLFFMVLLGVILSKTDFPPRRNPEWEERNRKWEEIKKRAGW